MRLVEGIATVEDVETFVADLSAIGSDHGCTVQPFSAELVAGNAHLDTAVERAHRSLEREQNIADDPAVEILLWAAGRRQIDQAIELGVTVGRVPVVVVIDGPETNAEDRAAEEVRDRLDPEPTLGTHRDEARIREYFGITEAEVAASDASLEELVIERVSLLDVER